MTDTNDDMPTEILKPDFGDVITYQHTNMWGELSHKIYDYTYAGTKGEYPKRLHRFCRVGDGRIAPDGFKDIFIDSKNMILGKRTSLGMIKNYYTRTDTIPKQEALDSDTIMIKRNVLEKLDNAIVRANLALVRNNEIVRAMDLTDASQAIDEILEPAKETQKHLHVDKTCKENAEILADKDRVMDMMAEALKTCEWIRDENNHDWFHYDEEKVAQALKEYKRLKR